jgi:hypothetical protein
MTTGSAFTQLTDVTSRDGCTLADDAIFVASSLPESFPPEASFSSSSAYAVGTAPLIYRTEDTLSLSIVWVNTVGSEVHVVAGTAVVGVDGTSFESPVYFRFSLSADVSVSTVVVEPAGPAFGTDPLYNVSLFTSDGAHECEARQSTSDQSITQECAPDDLFNNYVESESLAPIRAIQGFSLISEDDVFNIASRDIMFAGNGGQTN